MTRAQEVFCRLLALMSDMELLALEGFLLTGQKDQAVELIRLLRKKYDAQLRRQN